MKYILETDTGDFLKGPFSLLEAVKAAEAFVSERYVELWIVPEPRYCHVVFQDGKVSFEVHGELTEEEAAFFRELNGEES